MAVNANAEAGAADEDRTDDDQAAADEPGRRAPRRLGGVLRRVRPGLWPTLSLVISVSVALPVIAVIVSASGDARGEWSHLAATRLSTYAGNTAILAVSVCLIASAVGVATAWLVSVCEFPGRGVLRWALLLPLAAPAYLIAYAYTDLLQFSGPIQRGQIGRAHV